MLSIHIKGTLQGLSKLYPWDTLCILVHVDPYKRCMVPEDEVFTITEKDFIDAGLLTLESNDG